MIKKICPEKIVLKNCVKDADHFYELLTEWQTPKFEGTQNK